MEPVADSSMPGRPTPDRSLDERIALLAVREQLPALECRSAMHIGSGWAFDVYLLDDCYIARFPRNASIARELDLDERIHRFVASLSLPFSTPNVIGRAEGGSYFPHDFLVCTHVPGIPSDRWIGPLPHQLTADLGRALTSIHSAPVRDARRVGVPAPEQSASSTPPCFLHGDFGGGNLIVHPDTGRLVGVIDWGNSEIGEPKSDFIWLMLDRGWSFMRAVLSAYQLPVEHDFLDRVRGHAQSLAHQWLFDAAERGWDSSLKKRWVRNALSLDT